MATPTCKPILLIDQADFCIAQCQHCQRIGLTFNNLLLGFKQEEFIALCKTIETVDFEQCCTLMTNGQPYLIVNTGHPDIQFSLSKIDFGRFRTGLIQALRRMNLHQLLKIQSN
ncbi:DUF6686 family protein [Spirosoma foliorum]|uniref:Uncharacterized protein n=1 Tax=Spirosoma foliorum TaxID=2710596 RepID=A0A7G5GYC2_9BACT|nr:DUF6686 family protein [Spirosoma foliorum]QMW03864.1 hypothetical protein H3H32_02595 [Spirosoma foliorum]